jgi:hypothetical protein
LLELVEMDGLIDWLALGVGGWMDGWIDKPASTNQSSPTTQEPFVDLLKGSLQTFLNAFTYPDRTCELVALKNEWIAMCVSLSCIYNIVPPITSPTKIPPLPTPLNLPTGYPVASQNTKDFYNLIHVYLDAVLHPRAVDDPLVRGIIYIALFLGGVF